MLKFISLLVVVVFFIWLLRRQWRLKKMQWRGEKPPEPKGLRPITLLSWVFVVVYGGYMLWYLVSDILLSSGE
jgi:Na+/H+ antiporter NhaD/arsenite permease-like protein